MYIHVSHLEQSYLEVAEKSKDTARLSRIFSKLFRLKPTKIRLRRYIHYPTNAMKTIQLIGHPDPVPISSIVWLEGEASYTRVHYQNGTYAIVTQPLQWFEQHLDLVRVHRSAIINPIYVQEFTQKRGRSGWIRLPGDLIIPVSRTRLELVAARITQFKSNILFPGESQNSQIDPPSDE